MDATVKRRNKWICALKTSLAELKIFGPTGNPDAEAPPKKYTEIPWEEVRRNEDWRLYTYFSMEARPM